MSDQAIRVVVFSSGPELEHGARRFLVRLEDHPDIELVGVYSESEGQSIGWVIKDLWHRRRFLAIPLFVAWLGSALAANLRSPRRERRLRAAMAGLADRVHYVTDIHAPAVIEAIRSLEPDLGLVYGAPILRPELFEVPGMGTLGVHHGRLPQYRGKKTTFWEMYHREPSAGVTIQLINRGLDTGQIVMQGAVEIGSRSRSAVWRRLESLGLDLYIAAILAMRDGTADPRPQEGPKGQLFRDPPPRLVMALWWRQLRKTLLRMRSRRAPG